MSKEVPTAVGVVYCVTAAPGCTVELASADGSTLTLCTTGDSGQASFVGTGDAVIVSDNKAKVFPFVRAAVAALGGGSGDRVPAEDLGVFDVIEYDPVRGMSVVHLDSEGKADGRLRLMVTQYGENLVGRNAMTLQAPSITYSTAHEAASYTDSATGSSYLFWGHTLSTTEMAAYGIEEACTWVGDAKLPLRLRGTEVTVNGESMIPEVTFDATSTAPISGAGVQDGLDERFADLALIDDYSLKTGKRFVVFHLKSTNGAELNGNVSLTGTATCSGSATFNSYVDIYGAVSLSGDLTTSGNLRLYEDSRLEVWPSSGVTRTILATYPPDSSEAVDSLQVSPEGELLTRGKKVATEDMCVSYGNPAGTIIMHAADAVAGYLLCNGAAVSRTDYADLFAAIGTKFGAGDGSSTFNLPDFRNRAPWGADGNVGTKLAGGAPNIWGEVVFGASYSPIGDSSAVYGAFDKGTSVVAGHNVASSTLNSKSLIINAARSSSVYGNSSTIQPPALAINFFIKY